VGASTFQVYVNVGIRWRRVGTVEAPSHSEAWRRAISSLPAEHYDKPVKVEPPKPPEKRRPK
jgi:hypothetical protein